jgi:hypothetical protein
MQTTGSPGPAARSPARSDSDRCGGNRRSRWRRDFLSVRAAMPHRIGLLLGASVVCLLSLAASGLADYWRSLAQNTAADLIGAIVAMYVLIPITQRSRPDAMPHGDTAQDLVDSPAAVTEGDAQPPSPIADTPSNAGT